MLRSVWPPWDQGGDVVCFAEREGCGAAGEDAAFVAGVEGDALGRGEESLGAADVEGLVVLVEGDGVDGGVAGEFLDRAGGCGAGALVERGVWWPGSGAGRLA